MSTKEENKKDEILWPSEDGATSSKVAWINTRFFFALIILGGLLLVFLPKEKISESEKRYLCKFPTYSNKNLFTGTYTDSIELYFADNFPFRESMVQFSSGLKELYGYRPEDVMIYTIEPEKNKLADATDAPAQMDTIAVDSITVAQLDSMVVMDTVKSDGEYVKSVFIYDGRAFQIFGGSKHTAKPFSNMVNQYRKILPPEVKLFCMEIPTPIDFYLPAKYKKKQNSEKSNIDLVYASLDSGIVAVHAYEELQKNTSKYLYFNTDHHWTGLGGYYAYRAFCAAAGFQAYELEAFEKKTKRKFLGTLYALTHDKRLKENIDSVEYFKLPIKTTVSYFNDEKSKKRN